MIARTGVSFVVGDINLKIQFLLSLICEAMDTEKGADTHKEETPTHEPPKEEQTQEEPTKEEPAKEESEKEQPKAGEEVDAKTGEKISKN
jgi:hypothetical protein